MDAVVFSESATPRRRSVRLQANSIQDSVSNSQKRKTATSASRTPKRHKSDEATVTPLRKKGSTTPSSSRQAPRSQTRSSGMKGGSKTENHRPGSYGIAQLSDGDLDWATMIPPQPKFQLARTPPVKRNDDGVKANAGDDSNTTQQQLREVSSSELNIVAGNTDITTTSTATLPVDTSVVTSKEAVVTDRVDDVAEEVVLTSAQSPVDVENVSDVVVVCDDGACAVSNTSVVFPIHNKDKAMLPATLQCTDNDLAYLERMANVKLYKELTHQKGQLGKDLKSATQDIEQLTYKYQKADEDYVKLSTDNKRAAIIARAFLNDKNSPLQEPSTEQLATSEATLDKQTVEQLQQVHKELKVELQSVNRSVEKKKVMLEKERKLNQGVAEKTAALQSEKEQLTGKLKEMDEQEADLREQLHSLQQQQLSSEEEDDIHQREKHHFIVQKKILSQRCDLYIQRQNNLKQIREYMQGFLTRVKQGNVSINV